MKLKSLLVPFAVLAFSASAYAGPSAKFAATYTDEGPWLTSMASVSVDGTGAVDANGNYVDYAVDSHTGYTLATIKVPQDKELLVGVSSEVGLVTDTSIKGKNGGSAKAIAGAGAEVTVMAFPVDGGPGIVAAPGPVTLSKRVQTLDATLGGVIQSCTDGNADGTINIADDCVVTDEEIGLILDTLASHHFNFVLPNLSQGEYNIKAIFTTTAEAQAIVDGSTVIIDDSGDSNITASAEGKAFIGKTMVTVQQVRATSDGIIEADIVEQ